MNRIRYDLIGAEKAGVIFHPQKQVESLGIKVLSYEGVPIADCIIMEVDNVPEELPSYIDLITNTKESTTKPDQPTKKGGFKLKHFFLLFILIFVVMCVRQMDESKQESAVKESAEKRTFQTHCRADWNEIDRGVKSLYLNEFIDYYGFSWDLSTPAIKGIEAAATYPESVLVDGKKIGKVLLVKPAWARVTNVEDGLITYTIPFTTENAFKQTVRANLEMKIRYTAGCKPPTIVSTRGVNR